MLKSISRYYCFALILVLSCKAEPAELTYNLPIPEETMIKIMMDLAIAESMVSNNIDTLRDSIKVVYKSQIEKIYNIPMSSIDSNLNLLYAQPALNQYVQKRVIDSLRVLEESIRNIK